MLTIYLWMVKFFQAFFHASAVLEFLSDHHHWSGFKLTTCSLPIFSSGNESISHPCYLSLTYGWH